MHRLLAKGRRFFDAMQDTPVDPNAAPDAETGLSSNDYAAIFEQVRPFTMVGGEGITFTAWETLRLICSDVPGVLVECGTWRGGASMAMLLAQRQRFGRVVRPVYMLDSFEGLPRAEDVDGPLARLWQSGERPDLYFDNCRASLEEVQFALASMGFTEKDYVLMKGWFEATAPDLATLLTDRRIALLRLDADWYSSTKICVDHLFPLVAEGGTMVIDDYYAWDGCAKAINEFVGTCETAYRITSIRGCEGAFIQKRVRLSFDS
jgi:O-methyltransferase